MFGEFLDARRVDFGLSRADSPTEASLVAGSEEDKGSSGSDSDASGEASARHSGSPPPEKLRRRISLPGFLRSERGVSSSYHFESSIDDPNLLDEEILARGPLIHVRGWWRKGPRLAERFAEIRKLESESMQFVWRRCGEASELKPKTIQLSGVALEALDLQQEGLFGFRLHPLPNDPNEALDFAASSALERDRWLQFLAKAAGIASPEGSPLAGVLSLTVLEASAKQEQGPLRRHSGPLAELFLVVRIGGRSWRTAPRRQEATKSGQGLASFASTVDFPIADDDPDSLVSIELWAQDRRRQRLRGRIDVPLYCMGRRNPREMCLPLRDPLRPKGEAMEIGTVEVSACFQQSLGSLFLPRPHRQTWAWHSVGDKPLREQLKEFEVFLQTFEAFSSRFVHHCDVWRNLGFEYRRIVQWDSPAITLSCLTGLTVLIGSFHEQILPVSVLALFGVVLWNHPQMQRLQKAMRSLPLKEGRAFSESWLSWLCRKACRRSKEPTTEVPHASSSLELAEKLSLRSFSLPQMAQAPVKERFENERRLVLGKFTSQRLRFYDPPAWSDAEGRRVEQPKQVEDGIQYTWRIEVNRFTDSDGWRYSRSFGRGAVWRNAFNAFTFVRRRRHVGRPLHDGASVALPSPRQKSGEGALPGITGCVDGVAEAGSKALSSVMPRLISVMPSLAAEIQGSPSRSRQLPHDLGDVPSPSRSGVGPQNEGPKGPEFGIAKTPFHDMFQQYLLRWAFLQRQIEYWMDFYERRKNLMLGSTLLTQNFALFGVLLLLLAAIVLPTRFLCLAWIYGVFWDGYAQGRLMRENRGTFIQAFKDAAMSQWLQSSEARARAEFWGPSTSLDEIVNAGVQLLGVRDWIRLEFYDGRPMVPLRAIQRCKTLCELAEQVTWTSDRFSKIRHRARVWYRSTFRNLLDHVPSDATFFQPLTCQGLGDGSGF